MSKRQRLKRLRIEAIDRKPSTSKPTPGHKIYPCLLRRLTIDRPNQVWAMEPKDRAATSPACRWRVSSSTWPQ